MDASGGNPLSSCINVFTMRQFHRSSDAVSETMLRCRNGCLPRYVCDPNPPEAAISRRSSGSARLLTSERYLPVAGSPADGEFGFTAREIEEASCWVKCDAFASVVYLDARRLFRHERACLEGHNVPQFALWIDDHIALAPTRGCLVFPLRRHPGRVEWQLVAHRPVGRIQ